MLKEEIGRWWQQEGPGDTGELRSTNYDKMEGGAGYYSTRLLLWAVSRDGTTSCGGIMIQGRAEFIGNLKRCIVNIEIMEVIGLITNLWK